MREIHYPNCENATSRTCRCAWCSGTRHGWVGAVDLALRPDPTGYNEFRDQVEKTWQEERAKQDRRKNKKPTFPYKATVIDLCRADLIGWLRSAQSSVQPRQNEDNEENPGNCDHNAPARREENATTSNTSSGSRGCTSGNDENGKRDLQNSPNEESAIGHVTMEGNPVDDASSQDDDIYTTAVVIDDVQQLGDKLLRDVLADIEKEYGGDAPVEVRRAMADHFWCDLLAHIAHALDQGSKVMERIPDRISELIMKSRENENRLPLEEFIVKSAVKNVWKHLGDLAVYGLLGKSRAVLPVVRLLAILMCKKPERHRAVVEYCIDRIGGQLREATKQILLDVFREWMPTLQTKLGVHPKIRDGQSGQSVGEC